MIVQVDTTAKRGNKIDSRRTWRHINAEVIATGKCNMLSSKAVSYATGANAAL